MNLLLIWVNYSQPLSSVLWVIVLVVVKTINAILAALNSSLPRNSIYLFTIHSWIVRSGITVSLILIKWSQLPKDLGLIIHFSFLSLWVSRIKHCFWVGRLLTNFVKIDLSFAINKTILRLNGLIIQSERVQPLMKYVIKFLLLVFSNRWSIQNGFHAFLHCLLLLWFNYVLLINLAMIMATAPLFYSTLLPKYLGFFIISLNLFVVGQLGKLRATHRFRIMPRPLLWAISNNLNNFGRCWFTLPLNTIMWHVINRFIF